MEAAEPVFTSCGWISHTIWYRYTPTDDQILYGSGNATSVNTFMAVYTGSSLDNLTEIGCASEHHVFSVKAGTTYYIQLGSYDGQGGAPQIFSLDLAPLPSLAMFFNPNDPSTFDTTQFSAFVFDPAHSGNVQYEQWDFGDGSGADGFSVSHQYAADGTYTVTLTVTMTDGRVATTSTPLTVKTHDVAISKLVAPQTASSRPKQDDQHLRRQLPLPRAGTAHARQEHGRRLHRRRHGHAHRPGGESDGVQVQLYVFSADDGAIGKVSFRATATIWAHATPSCRQFDHGAGDPREVVGCSRRGRTTRRPRNDRSTGSLRWPFPHARRALSSGQWRPSCRKGCRGIESVATLKGTKTQRIWSAIASAAGDDVQGRVCGWIRGERCDAAAPHALPGGQLW